MDLRGYDILIESFLEKKITVEEFERTYLDKFVEEDILGDDLYQPLQWLFSEVDEYTSPEFYPLEEGDVDEAQLRKTAAEILEQIRALK
ncbi:MAG: colicin immunity domain-containing protein [Alphaproteobacteria bacterium]|nr:colicin immunity domain-containing protein [Alphaproteobacteria bacterium]